MTLSIFPVYRVNALVHSQLRRIRACCRLSPLTEGVNVAIPSLPAGLPRFLERETNIPAFVT